MKKFLLILLVFIFCGCSAEYNLDIKNDNYNETIKISFPSDKKEEYANYITNNLSVKSNVYAEKIYNSKIEDDSFDTRLTYNNVYSLNEYKNSPISSMFEKFRVDEENGVYSIIGENFSGFGDFEVHADEYTININTDYKVLKTNADKRIGNKYTWIINKKNYKNKSIVFEYSKTNQKINIFSIIKPIIISFIIASLIIFIVFILDERKKNVGDL